MNNKEIAPYSTAGHCHSSFGELLQGQLTNGEKFLVNFKIKQESHALIKKDDHRILSALDFSKSHRLIKKVLDDYNLKLGYDLTITSDIPIGKGLSSSTADMVATAIALFKYIERPYERDYISKVITSIEPNDALHYRGTSAYHHTLGKLIFNFEYIPPFKIIGVDLGGTVDTIDFNRHHQVFSYDKKARYEQLLQELKLALEARDYNQIANVATESFILCDSGILPKIKENALAHFQLIEALGMVKAHSGTYFGYLLAHDIKNEDLDKKLKIIQASFGKNNVRVFETALE